MPSASHLLHVDTHSQWARKEAWCHVDGLEVKVGNIFSVFRGVEACWSIFQNSPLGSYGFVHGNLKVYSLKLSISRFKIFQALFVFRGTGNQGSRILQTARPSLLGWRPSLVGSSFCFGSARGAYRSWCPDCSTALRFTCWKAWNLELDSMLCRIIRETSGTFESLWTSCYIIKVRKHVNLAESLTRRDPHSIDRHLKHRSVLFSTSEKGEVSCVSANHDKYHSAGSTYTTNNTNNNNKS